MSRFRELWAAFVRWYEARNERERRILVGGGIFAALLLGYFAVIEPLMQFRADLATQIAEKHAQLEGEARLVTRAAALRSERDSLRQRLKVEKEKLLPGESNTLASAALQERLNTLATQKGVTVQSVQVLKDEPEDPFVRVAVRVTLSGELRPLAEMLAGLEYGKTQISVPFIELNRRGAMPGSKGPRPLSATVEASGFILARGAAEPPPDADGGPPEGAGPPGGEPGPPPADAPGTPPAGEAPPPEPGTPPEEGAPHPAPGAPEGAEDAPPEAPPPATVPPPTGRVPTPEPHTRGVTPPPAPKPEGVIEGTAPPPVPPRPAPSPVPEDR